MAFARYVLLGLVLTFSSGTGNSATAVQSGTVVALFSGAFIHGVGSLIRFASGFGCVIVGLGMDK